jgi:hypothetical protein
MVQLLQHFLVPALSKKVPESHRKQSAAAQTHVSSSPVSFLEQTSVDINSRLSER